VFDIWRGIVLGLMVAFCDTAAFSQQNSPGRVVLYEEDPTDSNGKSYTGSVVWSLENVPAGPGKPMEKALRGNIAIPGRNMTVTFTLRHNTDRNLPATSHTVSIDFHVPANFSRGGVQEVRGLLMKQSEEARGIALAVLSVKVTAGLFLIGLSGVEEHARRNISMLMERGWLDIAIVYNDNRRAILAVEKGAAGDRLTRQAFAFWGTFQPSLQKPEATAAPKARAEKFSGTGFFVNDTGNVLTNSHVVDGCLNIAIKMNDGQVVPAHVVAANDADDLAVLRTRARAEKYGIFRSGPPPRSGDPIVVFGFPLAGLLASTGNATFGNITALAGLRDNPHEMQISAPVQPGNSGGPVLDSSGKVWESSSANWTRCEWSG
jgi:hypothetical protein